MGAVQVQHYLGRARDFLKGMELLKEDLEQYRHSSALLGIHGAISYCDALRIGLGGKNLSSDDHSSAAKELRNLLTGRKFKEQQGVPRLEKLLSQKNLISYSVKTVSEAEVVAIITHARRFAVWAETTGKRLKIEGWQDA